MPNFTNEHDNWYEGVVYDINGMKKSGYINYNYVVDNLRFKQKKEIRTLTSKNISSFNVRIGEEVRKFYAIPYKNLDSGREYLHFFELQHQTPEFMTFSRNVVDYYYANEQHQLRKHKVTENLYEVIYVANTKKGNCSNFI